MDSTAKREAWLPMASLRIATVHVGVVLYLGYAGRW